MPLRRPDIFLNLLRPASLFRLAFCLSFFLLLSLPSIASGNKDIRILYENAIASIKEEKVEEARIGFQQVIEIKPDFAPAYYNLGLIQMRRDNMVEASDFFEKAIQLGSSGAQIHYLWGTTLIRRGDIERAKKAYLEAVRQNPIMTNALRDLGILYYQTKDYDQSVFFLNRAFLVEPTSAKTMWLLGLAYIQAHKLENAMEMITGLRAVKDEQRATDLESIIKKIHGKSGVEAPLPPEKPVPAKPVKQKGSASLTGNTKISGNTSITGNAKMTGRGSMKRTGAAAPAAASSTTTRTVTRTSTATASASSN